MLRETCIYVLLTIQTRSQLKGRLTYFSHVAKDISTSRNFRAKEQLCHPSPGQSIFALIKTVY